MGNTGTTFEFGWIKMSLNLMLVLQFTAVTGQDSFLIVRDGDEAALPCTNARHGQDKCGSTYWTFSHSIDSAVDLVELGQIGKDAQTKSDRLSLTENCSLVLKNVTREDVGLYICRQIDKSEQQLAPDSVVLLSVVTMTEQKDGDEVTLTCSLSTYTNCKYSVKWQFIGTDVDKYNKDLRTSQKRCSAIATFSASHFIYTSKKYELLKCEVTSDSSEEKQQFTFRSQSSGWWWYVIAAVGSAALLITVVVLVIRWRRNKGSITQTEENKADPEDGVSYSSVSFPKTTDSKGQIRGGGDAVTYSTVRAPSTDPSNLYATVN
ncbi:uncharacterized protein LOC130160790 isoform X2 [Seriola aureovittata]|uniref:uncharacterized protein LOC130160790 isoform X2 n=1 Tax=Seriola aureovittata TaxID=2871759 RepID=UPI0024BE9364|nr:uncharacterized protein LOC130160790 isoform X2 [Seriola aureovittata]